VAKVRALLFLIPTGHILTVIGSHHSGKAHKDSDYTVMISYSWL